MADDRLFRVIVLGGAALIGAAPVAGCTPSDASGEGTQVPQSQTVVVPSASAAVPVPSFIPPPPPREGPPPPRDYPPIKPVTSADAGAASPPIPPPVDAGADSGPLHKPPREGPPPRIGF